MTVAVTTRALRKARENRKPESKPPLMVIRRYAHQRIQEGRSASAKDDRQCGKHGC
jgi:hypothetical protein